MTPQILAPDYGAHNAMLDQAIKRLDYAGSYKDLSTIIVIPGFGQMPTKCVASWMNMVTPPNQKCFRMWALGMEVGEAFSQTISNILAHIHSLRSETPSSTTTTQLNPSSPATRRRLFPPSINHRALRPRKER